MVSYDQVRLGRRGKVCSGVARQARYGVFG